MLDDPTRPARYTLLLGLSSPPLSVGGGVWAFAAWFWWRGAIHDAWGSVPHARSELLLILNGGFIALGLTVATIGAAAGLAALVVEQRHRFPGHVRGLVATTSAALGLALGSLVALPWATASLLTALLLAWEIWRLGL